MAKRKSSGRRKRSTGSGGSRMPAHLQRSYVSGKVAARIRWGRPGDFTACTTQAAKHGVPGRMRNGMCARLHHKATGRWPGKNRGH